MHWRTLLALSFVSACTGNISDPGAQPPVSGPLAGPDDPIQPLSGFRRLSPDELQSSLEWLVGDLPAETTEGLRRFESTPYDNDVATQTASLQLVRATSEMVEGLFPDVLDASRRRAFVPCSPTGYDDASCLREFIMVFGQRAFRRPLRDEEVEEYAALMSFAAEAHGDDAIDTGYDDDFYLSVELVMRAMLQDPEFLYRIEAGTPGPEGIRRLGGWEIATRMAYFLWGNAPSEDLVAAATAGELEGPEGRARWAQRMLEDERAVAQWTRFHSMWLGYRQLTLPRETRELLRRETDALVRDVVFDNPRSYLDLFLAEGSFMNREIAEHYNSLITSEGMSEEGMVPVPSSEALEWVSYEASGRRGILSHGSFLASFGKFEDTSPTQRGLLVRTRLLCTEIPLPDASLEVNVDSPPAASEPGACKNERYAQHRDDARCASCHERLDPVGFGLERFDNAGRWREHEAGRPECRIDGEGALSGVGAFNGPAELAERLIEDGRLPACVMEQLMTHAWGRALTSNDAAALGAWQSAFEANDYDLRATLVALVAADEFVLRRDEGEE